LPDGSSIFSAEARAILLALNIADMSANENFMILSCLQSIENKKLTHPLIPEVINFTHKLISLSLMANKLLLCGYQAMLVLLAKYQLMWL
jgi:hypothetical protein